MTSNVATKKLKTRKLFRKFLDAVENRQTREIQDLKQQHGPAIQTYIRNNEDELDDLSEDTTHRLLFWLSIPDEQLGVSWDEFDKSYGVPSFVSQERKMQIQFVRQVLAKWKQPELLIIEIEKSLDPHIFESWIGNASNSARKLSPKLNQKKDDDWFFVTIISDLSAVLSHNIQQAGFDLLSSYVLIKIDSDSLGLTINATYPISFDEVANGVAAYANEKKGFVKNLCNLAIYSLPAYPDLLPGFFAESGSEIVLKSTQIDPIGD